MSLSNNSKRGVCIIGYVQDINSKKEIVKDFKIDSLPLEDKQRLVGAFVWLIEEDKRQNPALYQYTKNKND